MLGQCRRRWANINPALVQRLVFAEMLGYFFSLYYLIVYDLLLSSGNTKRGITAEHWASVANAGPTLKQHRFNVPCLLGCMC